MKKILCKVAMIATILCGGFSMTSCGSEDLTSIITSALTLWQQLQQGTQVTFKGTSAVKRCTSDGSSWTYDPSEYATGISATCSMGAKSNQASFVLTDVTVGDYTVSNISLPAVTYSNDGTTGTIGESQYAYQASFTVTKKDGTSKSYTTATTTDGSISVPYAMVTGTLTSSGTLNLEVSLYTTETEAFVINCVATQQTTSSSN